MIQPELLPLASARCAWCPSLVDPLAAQQVAICDDPLDPELVTGVEQVCNACLTPQPLECELETDMVSYRSWWLAGEYRYEYARGAMD
ncbi:MAG: hypothetical protein H0U76_01900 [Ktedonobacteraceae bacterium]|nr:hypothetical protein [Ktedonobacteraceae bacterium]